jgi:hypothetical protein
MKPCRAYLWLILLAPIFTVSSFASASDCDPALVKDTYSSMSAEHVDYRLATFVSEDDYNQAKHDASGSGVIYGVPMGATWSDFQENIHKFTQSMSTSLTHDQARNVIWTGLSKTSAKAYIACINASLSSGGLHLEVKEATNTDVTILATWIPVGSRDSSQAAPTWAWSGPSRVGLPKKLTAGQTIISLKRPNRPMQLVANFDGRAASVIITPFPGQPSMCEVFAAHPVKPACFFNDANRPGLLPNQRLITVSMTNNCTEAYDYKIWSGQEPEHTQWISTTGTLKVGESYKWADANSDARIRVYAKPQSCSKITFPVPGSPGFNSNWDTP